MRPWVCFFSSFLGQLLRISRAVLFFFVLVFDLFYWRTRSISFSQLTKLSQKLHFPKPKIARSSISPACKSSVQNSPCSMLSSSILHQCEAKVEPKAQRSEGRTQTNFFLKFKDQGKGRNWYRMKGFTLMMNNNTLIPRGLNYLCFFLKKKDHVLGRVHKDAKWECKHLDRLNFSALAFPNWSQWLRPVLIHLVETVWNGWLKCFWKWFVGKFISRKPSKKQECRDFHFVAVLFPPSLPPSFFRNKERGTPEKQVFPVQCFKACRILKHLHCLTGSFICKGHCQFEDGLGSELLSEP